MAGSLLVTSARSSATSSGVKCVNWPELASGSECLEEFLFMNLIFCGTPQFAVPTLNALVGAGHNIALVVTQPDRPSGRGNRVLTSAVKQRAGNLGLALAQPEKLKNNPEFQSRLRTISPDAIVVVAYGRLIPGWMLTLPSLGALNVHASLLPRYRGAAPVQWAIANGEKTTGVTIMQLDEGLDTGPILLQKEVPIAVEDTTPTLLPLLAHLGATLLVDALGQLRAGTIAAIAQDHTRATFAPLLKKEDGQINSSQTAIEVYNRLRGFQPWPGVYTRFRGRQLGVGAARVTQHLSPVSPSRIVVQPNQLFFSCAAGTMLEVLELHPEGKKSMTAREFLSGYRPQTNEPLG